MTDSFEKTYNGMIKDIDKINLQLIICPLKSVICHLSSVICSLALVICPL